MLPLPGKADGWLGAGLPRKYMDRTETALGLKCALFSYFGASFHAPEPWALSIKYASCKELRASNSHWLERKEMDLSISYNWAKKQILTNVSSTSSFI